MTRGKQAAQAARRRERAAQDSRQQLLEQVKELKRKHAEETRVLRSQIEDLRSQLTNQVDHAAADRVRATERRMAGALQRERQHTARRMRALLRHLVASDVLFAGEIDAENIVRQEAVPGDLMWWRRLADLSGIPHGEIIGMFGEWPKDRQVRRLRAEGMNKIMARTAEVNPNLRARNGAALIIGRQVPGAQRRGRG